jgi:hypothetical protein
MPYSILKTTYKNKFFIFLIFLIVLLSAMFGPDLSEVVANYIGPRNRVKIEQEEYSCTKMDPSRDVQVWKLYGANPDGSYFLNQTCRLNRVCDSTLGFNVYNSCNWQEWNGWAGSGSVWVDYDHCEYGSYQGTCTRNVEVPLPPATVSCSSTCTTSKNANGACLGPVSVTGSGNEPVSGYSISGIEFSNGASCSGSSCSITVSSVGSHNLSCWAVSTFGDTSLKGDTSFQIASLPTFTAVPPTRTPTSIPTSLPTSISTSIPTQPSAPTRTPTFSQTVPTNPAIPTSTAVPTKKPNNSNPTATPTDITYTWPTATPVTATQIPTKENNLLEFVGTVVEFSEEFIRVDCNLYLFTSETEIEDGIVIGSQVGGEYYIDEEGRLIAVSIWLIKENILEIKFSGTLENITSSFVVIDGHVMRINEDSLYSDELLAGVYVIGEASLFQGGDILVREIGKFSSDFVGEVDRVGLPDFSGRYLIVVDGAEYYITNETKISAPDLAAGKRVAGITNPGSDDLTELSIIPPFPFDILKGHRTNSILVYLLTFLWIPALLIGAYFLVTRNRENEHQN